MQDVKNKWDRIYAKSDALVHPEPCSALSQYDYLLPQAGTALDIACGLGGNAFFLAERGFAVTAIDISSVAIEKINTFSHPLIQARCEAVNGDSFKGSSYNVLTVSNFLDRSICGSIAAAVAPGGLLFYQTFVADKVSLNVGPRNPAYLLESNELLSLFSGWKVLVYSDVATVGDTMRGVRNQSFLIAQRPDQ